MTIIIFIILSLTILVFILTFTVIWQTGTNRYLTCDQHMKNVRLFNNKTHAILGGKIDTAYLWMITLFFLTLHLNASSAIADLNHAYFPTFVNLGI